MEAQAAACLRHNASKPPGMPQTQYSKGLGSRRRTKANMPAPFGGGHVAAMQGQGGANRPVLINQTPTGLPSSRRMATVEERGRTSPVVTTVASSVP